MKPKIYHAKEHGLSTAWIDPDALYVVKTLQKEGFTAYLVGGCVRDILLGQKPKDFDVSTSARPEEIKRIFKKKCILIGRRFRLAHIRFLDRKIIEVATFRSGNNDDDSLIIRDNVWGTEEEDVMRRDFTINGLFYDPIQHTIIDYVDGYKDAQKKFLQAIGDPFIRFKQDPVRMIRLVKFQARFSVAIEEKASDALFACRKEILKSSPARLLEEFLRMFESGSAKQFIELLRRYGIISILLPEVSKHLESPLSKDILAFFQTMDKLVKTQSLRRVSRSILLCFFVFPPFKKHLEIIQKGRRKPIHLGDIFQEALSFIHNMFSPVIYVPKRISAKMVSILTTQFRFTPLSEQKNQSSRVPKLPDLGHALEFLRIRSLLDPSLAPVYTEWLKLCNQTNPFLPSHKVRYKIPQ